jgi:RNA polymerase sigma factor (sigma-70 family)
LENDQKIWNDFRRGDKNALTYVYYQHIGYLYNYGLRFTHDKEQVKDTVQDLFLDLIRTRENLGDTDSIRFYLMKAYRRRLILHSIKSKRQISLEGKNIPDTESSAEEFLVQKESLGKRETIVRKGLQELTSRQREILYYRFSCEMEYDQICELMSLKYESARKMIFRALKALKEKLDKTELT